MAATAMNAIVNASTDLLTEWLLHARPVGLVLGPNIIREEELAPPRQGAVETEAARALLSVEADEDAPVLPDPWAFFSGVLCWESRFVAGTPGGPALPDGLAVKVPEHEVTLIPDWAVRELGEGGGHQLLVKLHLDADADQRGAVKGWEASPHQQFERLLRDSGVPIGALIDRAHLRIVYAPRGETSGWIAFPLRSLATVAGRPMLGGLKLMLGHARLFTEPEHRRLPKLLARSREAQNQVSTRLAEQVLGALHELLRAFHAADRARIEALAAERPQHLYEGLLITLLRLVFLLFAEDRDMIPSARSGEAIEIYEEGYSVRGLYARLAEDRALNPDTMDERVGGWGRLLALFRLVHAGHPSGWITPRGGKLFDPQAFPFLEGRDDGEPLSAAGVLPIRDGALLRILEGLMTIEARTLTGERVRERLSYRALDVEQIGSVYETVMGFNVEPAAGRSLAIRAGKNNRTPVFVDLDQFAAAKGRERIKLLKEEADRGQLSAGVAKAVEGAKSVDELVVALDGIVDERGSPQKRASATGTPILQPTDERRRTGSHYTPRSLTAPIVEHALAPAFERLGPNATPEQILDLKVCDPAMGSGAFLVEACRALAVRLVAAWARYSEKKPVIPADEDEELHARRLVAQRCLYGVDKNPLATDLAKLSLWLATLARDHEFTFLDHALKSGDSLVGLTRDQIAAVHWDPSKPGLPLFRQLVEQRVAEAMKGRAEIRAAPDDTARVIQEARHRRLEDRIKDVRTLGDSVIAAFFNADKPKAREQKRTEVESWMTGSLAAAWDKLAVEAAALRQGRHPLPPFHWQIEFPEVFARENGGFDALIGNPPFLAGRSISGTFSLQYLDWLHDAFPESAGQVDLVTFFLRRAFNLIRPKEGAFGLLATKTISQGDSRLAGLMQICKAGGVLFNVTKRIPWPGGAAVTVSAICAAKNFRPPGVRLDGRPVDAISPYLVPGNLIEEPARLARNKDNAFMGYYNYGEGFVFDDGTPNSEPTSRIAELLKNDTRNQDRIFPLIAGEELLDSPTVHIKRYVIDFADMSEEEARSWPDLFKILETRVKPQRAKSKRDRLRKFWWQFGETRPGLRRATVGKSRLLMHSYVSKHLAFGFVPSTVYIASPHYAITLDSFGSFASLQTRVHELWTRFFASSLEERLTYSASGGGERRTEKISTRGWSQR
jgi:hypothetical protein